MGSAKYSYIPVVESGTHLSALRLVPFDPIVVSKGTSVPCVPAQPALMPSILQSRAPATASDCLEFIRRGDPAAAQDLYSRYAAHVRDRLRRRTGVNEVEDLVLSVLIRAARLVRELGAASVEELSQAVDALTERSAFEFHRASSGQHRDLATADLGREATNTVFTALDISEREVLLRSVLLSEGDEEISEKLSLPLQSIGRTRDKARLLFRIAELKAASVDSRLANTEYHSQHCVQDEVRTI